MALTEFGSDEVGLDIWGMAKGAFGALASAGKSMGDKKEEKKPEQPVAAVQATQAQAASTKDETLKKVAYIGGGVALLGILAAIIVKVVRK